jgi:type III restriction enzyme
LFQAEEKGRDVTKEVLLAHLMEQEHIDRNKIAVVTGDQKELDGINLFARDCPIDYVITVEALKEGWDCSFAYVFCSVASVYSAKDVEQLLGRVLRLPYAKRRSHPDLNRAYAYTAKASWQNAVGKLHDSLVQMGFDDTEALQAVEKAPPPALDLQGGKYEGGQSVPHTTFELREDVTAFAHNLSDAVKVEANPSGGCRISLQGNVPEETIESLVKQLPAEAANQVKAEIRTHNATVARNAAPSQRGVAFAVPQLCLWLDDEWITPDSDSLLDIQGWNLLDYSAQFEEADFRVTEQGIAWEIDLNLEGKITERYEGTADQINLDLVDTGWSMGQLCGWLERRCRQADITQPVLLEFVRRAVQYLLEVRHIAMPTLVRWRFVLAKLLLQRIAHNRAEAGKNTYQQCLFAPQALTVETRADYAFPFTANGYAPHWNYAGRAIFNKHYYPNVGELKGDGEEYECAKAIDMHPAVKHWVRNLDRRGFWLPLARNKFYPDFVAELNDGRILVVEYKGKHLITADEAKAKALVGELWERASNGKALFLMAEKEGAGTPRITEQIKGKVR